MTHLDIVFAVTFAETHTGIEQVQNRAQSVPSMKGRDEPQRVVSEISRNRHVYECSPIENVQRTPEPNKVVRHDYFTHVAHHGRMEKFQHQRSKSRSRRKVKAMHG